MSICNFTSTIIILMSLSVLGVESDSFVTVRKDRFIDPEGRELILHGVNLGISWHTKEEFVKMRQWGFNCVRLNIRWDRLEPQPWSYNEKYLEEIDKRIQWAKENNIYIIIDMHQDLFAEKIGYDGAPDWAVLDEGKPHIAEGITWGMAYFTSPAVKTAFDNFWANKPAPDGMGVQDHFAKTWAYLAKRYANEPAVLGYDLFNEPFAGSIIDQALSLQFQAISGAVSELLGIDVRDAQKLRELMISGDLMKYANDIELYKAFIDGGKSVTMEFEANTLAQFYRRVAKAIREVDPNHIIFIEAHIGCNTGTPSGLIPIVYDDGQRDPLQAFAPHGYDIVTDTQYVANADPRRIELIFSRHKETAKRLEMPALVGEWGAYYGHPNSMNAAQEVMKHIEKNLFSDTYWAFNSQDEVNKAPYFPILSKPYPSAVSGSLLQYESNFSNKSFSCSWIEDPKVLAPTRVYIPSIWFSTGYSVSLDPIGSGWSFEKIDEETSDGYIVIPPTGQPVRRNLKIDLLTSNK